MNLNWTESTVPRGEKQKKKKKRIKIRKKNSESIKRLNIEVGLEEYTWDLSMYVENWTVLVNLWIILVVHVVQVLTLRQRELVEVWTEGCQKGWSIYHGGTKVYESNFWNFSNWRQKEYDVETIVN